MVRAFPSIFRGLPRPVYGRDRSCREPQQELSALDRTMGTTEWDVMFHHRVRRWSWGSRAAASLDHWCDARRDLGSTAGRNDVARELARLKSSAIWQRRRNRR